MTTAAAVGEALLPREPTHAMVIAGDDAIPPTSEAIWRAMWDAGRRAALATPPLPVDPGGGAETIDAQHDETGRMWRGPRSELPPRFYEVAASPSPPEDASVAGLVREIETLMDCGDDYAPLSMRVIAMLTRCRAMLEATARELQLARSAHAIKLAEAERKLAASEATTMKVCAKHCDDWGYVGAGEHIRALAARGASAEERK